MLLPSGNPFKCHEEVLSLQPMIPPKRFDIFPLTGGCSEGLDAFRVFFKKQTQTPKWVHFSFSAYYALLRRTCPIVVRTITVIVVVDALSWVRVVKSDFVRT